MHDTVSSTLEQESSRCDASDLGHWERPTVCQSQCHSTQLLQVFAGVIGLRH